MNVTYNGKDKNLADASTIYWFDIDGEIYGLVEAGPLPPIVVDCDGCPNNVSAAINNALISVMTAEMRQE
jgi:hypothetical protein